MIELSIETAADDDGTKKQRVVRDLQRMLDQLAVAALHIDGHTYRPGDTIAVG